jgi:hypothetical protein
LDAQWTVLETLANSIRVTSPEAQRAALDAISADGSIIAWAGFADTSGTVLAASHGLLVGNNVSSRPWFLGGVKGPFAGDVHEAKLLAHLLQASDGSPPRFLDYSLPVFGADGSATGTVGIHIDFAWAESKIEQMAAALGIDVVLVSQDGTPIISTVPGLVGSDQLAALRLSSIGSERATLEKWPDGKQYFSVVKEVGGQDGRPSFGWRLIGRIEGSAFNQLLNTAYSAPLIAILALFSLLGLTTVLFIRLFVVPFEQLTASAAAVSNGEDVYPYESGRTRELASLSASLSKLQSGRDILNQPST